MVLDGKSSQEHLVNVGVPQSSILGSTIFLLYINVLPNDTITNIAIYGDDTTLYFKCDQVSNLWQQLEMAVELESDLQGTVDWDRKWLVDFNAGKTQLASIDYLITLMLLMQKWMGLFLTKNHLLRNCGCLSLYIISITKTASKKKTMLHQLQKQISRTVGPSLAATYSQTCPGKQCITNILHPDWSRNLCWPL